MFLPVPSLSVSYPQVDIIVGTPGRLDDLISTGKLSLSQIRFLVLDECVCTTQTDFKNSHDRFHQSHWFFTACKYNINVSSHPFASQDGLLSAGYTDFINRIHNQIPQVTSDGKRLQVTLRWVLYVATNVFTLCHVSPALIPLCDSTLVAPLTVIWWL